MKRSKHAKDTTAWRKARDLDSSYYNLHPGRAGGTSFDSPTGFKLMRKGNNEYQLVAKGKRLA